MMINMPKPFLCFKKISVLPSLTLLFLLSSCILDQDKTIAIEDIDFGTTDDTELFFRNIRQSDYELEERPQAKMNLFRLKAMQRDTTQQALYPVIIHHWLVDKAYLWLEPAYETSEPITVVIGQSGEKKTFQFDGVSPQNHLAIALAMFDANLNNQTIWIGDQEMMLENSSLRKNYQLVLNDYFRLLGLK